MHISMKCSVAVHCLIFMNEAGAGNRVTSALLSESTGCNPASIRALFTALKKAGIIDVQRGNVGARLIRDPKDVTLLDIQNAVEPNGLSTMIGMHAYKGQSCPVAKNIQAVLTPSYEKVEQAAAKAMSTITLAELIDDYHSRINGQDSDANKPTDRHQD
ncbi:Rrf2 family transcriptional regulator [Bifidobacterium sp. 82T24]|uniref:RrF2 family transcriptional regulator n=1 Tax=Bifidobacterium pluvialisilvae TaxID=2834436 RepID=UPI001C58E3B4|nr:Rrf2 family transcriptional regulator [Bifidobacterium pluvialisilvae]MBW3087435.1 Rrf2 family transcriptional regulator [Bifidobacterium pluvialisilvae]